MATDQRNERARRAELEKERTHLRAQVPELQQAVRRLAGIEERLVAIAYELTQLGGG